MNKSLKTAIIIGGVLIVLIGAVPLVLGAGWNGLDYWPGMMGGWVGWWIMPIMGIMMVVFWGLVIAGIVLLVRGIAGWGAGPSQREDSALEILKRRYARGEINKEEFEARKKDLL